MTDTSAIIYIELQTEQTFIQRAELRKTDTLISHLKAYLKTYEKDFNKTFGDQSVEVVFQGKLLEDSDKIPDKTTSFDRIKFYLKFVREPGTNPNEKFFKGRGWNFFLMRNNIRFNRLLQDVKDSHFNHNHSELKNLTYKSYLENESSKSSLITLILRSAFYNYEGFKLQNEFPIEVGTIHKVEADHALYDIDEHPVLITEDKAQRIDFGIIQNLDQLRSFSMTPEGSNQDTFYGLVSNHKEWVFTCYIKPEQGKPATQENFLISSIYDLRLTRKTVTSMKVEENGLLKVFDVDEPEEISARDLIQTIRGFVIHANQGKILERRFIANRMKSSPKQGLKKTEGGCDLLFSSNDWNIRCQVERDRILDKFKEGEVLVDVFCGNGSLSVRAAKKGLYVYANDIRSDYCNISLSNIERNGVRDKVQLYNSDTRTFIRNIIKKTKVQHIYMNQPQNAIEYLNEFTQAFLQKSTINYSLEELPLIYFYGFYSEGEIQDFKNDIIRKVQHELNKHMKKNLEANLLAVNVKISDANLYCLEFTLPYEVVQGNSSDEDEDFETYYKKVKIN